MAFDFAAQKARTSRIVHDTFGLPATYQDNRLVAPVELRVRWHYQEQPVGDNGGEGYALVLDFVEKVIFDKDELIAKGVRIQRGGRVIIRASGLERELAIDTKAEMVSAVAEAWHVGAIKNGGLAT